MKNISLKNRLILPIALLGIVALFSNILSIINIRHVNASAATISDNHMDAQSRLAQIYQTSMTIHKMALSHIVATDYETMIVLVQQIKEEETLLDGMLEAYEFHVTPQDRASYEKLLSDYASFKHALVQLVCASAGHKPQYAYTLANGDVASWANAMEEDINVLSSSIQEQTSWARDHLSSVYVLSLVVGTAAAAACILLIFADLKLITKYVVRPVKSILKTIQDSSGHINNMTGEVLKRTQASKGSAADLSSLAQELSDTIQEVASNVAAINDNTENVRLDVSNIAEECRAITAYSAQMNQRAQTMQRSAQDSADAASAKAEELLQSLNDAIEKSRSVDQIKNLTGEILAISQQTRLISLNASVEAANAGDAGNGFAVVASEVRELSHSSQEAANRIQEINSVVTAAVYNLSETAQCLVDYINQSVLTEFQAFVRSGSQYREDAAYIRRAMDAFQERTEHLKHSMSDITSSLGTIRNAIDEGAHGISGVAGNTMNLAADMEDITQRMGHNQEVVKDLENETAVFDNL